MLMATSLWNKSRLFAVVILLLSLTSCVDRWRLTRDMKMFAESSVTIPDDMECVFERSISTLDPAGLSSMKFIVYYDSLECSSCAVTHLMDLIPLYEKFENTDVGVMTIFSPRLEEVEDIKLELMLAAHLFPVYVDTNGSFARVNTAIPTDNRFDYFLIDKDGTPLFVGNPAANEKLNEILDNILLTL